MTETYCLSDRHTVSYGPALVVDKANLFTSDRTEFSGSAYGIDLPNIATILDAKDKKTVVYDDDLFEPGTVVVIGEKITEKPVAGLGIEKKL